MSWRPPYDLLEEVLEWKETYGKKKTSKLGSTFYEINFKNEERRKLFVILIEILKEWKTPKDFYSSGPNKDIIFKNCLPPRRTMGGSKYSKAIDAIAKDLQNAVRDVYGTELNYYKNNGKVRKKNKKASPSILEEQADQVQVEEIKKVSVPKPPPAPKKTIKKEPVESEDRDVLDPEWDAALGYVK
jgi:hypothetical protein